jgi:hypothetical protein
VRLQDLTIEIRDDQLKRVGQLVGPDLVGAKFVLRFNNPGFWSLKLSADSPVVELLRTPGYGIVLTDKSGVVLSGPTMSAKLVQSQNNPAGEWVIEGADDLLILQEKLAYPDPVEIDVAAQTESNDIRVGVAETVIKEYVDANIVSGPVGRQVPGLVIATDSGRGGTVRGNARFANLLELSYNLAQSGGIGYRIRQINDELVLDVYEPLDVSGKVRLDIDNGRLNNSEYAYSAPILTRAIVAGAGEALDRLFREVTTTESTTAESTWGRRIEQFVDDRGSEELDQLDQKGLERLIDDGKTRVTMAVTPADTVTMLYGDEWGLGDTITVVAGNIDATAVVYEVGIAIQEDGVYLAATVGNPTPLEFDSRLAAKQVDHEGRISNLERHEVLPAIGQVSRQTNGTVTITTAGQYVTTGLTSTLDTSTANGFIGGVTDEFGVKNNTDISRVMRVYASMDARGGNNQVHGLKLALNGTPIDATECRSFTGAGPNDFAKLVTSWVIRMEPDDEVSLLIANHSSTDNIVVSRGRVVATAV